jgi:hypothetical protein
MKVRQTWLRFIIMMVQTSSDDSELGHADDVADRTSKACHGFGAIYRGA